MPLCRINIPSLWDCCSFYCCSILWSLAYWWSRGSGLKYNVCITPNVGLCGCLLHVTHFIVFVLYNLQQCLHRHHHCKCKFTSTSLFIVFMKKPAYSKDFFICSLSTGLGRFSSSWKIRTRYGYCSQPAHSHTHLTLSFLYCFYLLETWRNLVCMETRVSCTRRDCWMAPTCTRSTRETKRLMSKTDLFFPAQSFSTSVRTRGHFVSDIILEGVETECYVTSKVWSIFKFSWI